MIDEKTYIILRENKIKNKKHVPDFETVTINRNGDKTSNDINEIMERKKLMEKLHGIESYYKVYEIREVKV